MKETLKYLALILACVMVFAAAKLLDSWPRKDSTPPQVRLETPAAEQTQPPPKETQPAPPETEAPVEAAEERFLLTLAGDCTLGGRQVHANADSGFLKTVGEDYGFPFRNVVEYFAGDELTLLNLEGPLCDDGYPVHTGYAFRGPTAYTSILTQSSVEAVSLANNHIMDYGQTGYDATTAALAQAGISYAEQDKETLITTENGLTVGIYGAVYFDLNTETITAAIRNLRKQADIVIFAPHWGYKMTAKHTDAQEELAHAAIDAGADIVWGCHPRVLQAMEEYNGGKIFYSLGNFCFGGFLTLEDYDSALIQQEVVRGADGTVTLGKTVVVPVCVSSVPGKNNFQPTPYEPDSEGYVRVLEKLGLEEKN